jgi:hypothetical protein
MSDPFVLDVIGSEETHPAGIPFVHVSLLSANLC